MKHSRRGFFARLFGVAAAAAVAPEIVEEVHSFAPEVPVECLSGFVQFVHETDGTSPTGTGTWTITTSKDIGTQVVR